MIYDVLHKYPEVAALYDDFDDAARRCAITMSATPSIWFSRWPYS
jgi:hypothetical protein